VTARQFSLKQTLAMHYNLTSRVRYYRLVQTLLRHYNLGWIVKVYRGTGWGVKVLRLARTPSRYYNLILILNPFLCILSCLWNKTIETDKTAKRLDI
jgi:hypothetical protein